MRPVYRAVPHGDTARYTGRDGADVNAGEQSWPVANEAQTEIPTRRLLDLTAVARGRRRGDLPSAQSGPVPADRAGTRGRRQTAVLLPPSKPSMPCWAWPLPSELWLICRTLRGGSAETLLLDLPTVTPAMQPGDQPGLTEIGESVQKSHATAATGKIWPDRQHAWRRADLLKSPRRGGLGGKPVSGTAGQRSGLRMRHHANIGLGGEIVARFAGQLRQMLATSSRRPASAGRVSAGQDGGGCEIRTREGLPPTRFPSVRPRPLGESSVAKPTESRQRPGHDSGEDGAERWLSRGLPRPASR